MHLYIFTSQHLYISTSLNLYISTSLHLYMASKDVLSMLNHVQCTKIIVNCTLYPNIIIHVIFYLFYVRCSFNTKELKI